jgi:hypothetical protein
VTSPHRIWLCAALPTALSALSGCGGAQAGGQTGEETDGKCVFATHPLAQQEPSPLGFSPEQVLVLAAGERQAEISWQQTQGVTYGPETGTSQATLRTAATGPARLAQVDRARSSGPFCEDHISIPVEVTLETSGGAFDESFSALLTATSADAASVTQIVRRAELRGAFAFSADTLGSRRFMQLEVNLRFSAESSAGYLFGGIEGSDPTGEIASYQIVPLACWGDVSPLSQRCAD